MKINFLFKEILTCGAVLSGFELCQALRRQGHDAHIVTEHRNKELEEYFNITPTTRREGTTITFTPRLDAEFAYIRTFDDRWKSYKEKKIAVSQAIADWIGTDIVIGNGTHERFYDMKIERDIDVLIEGNYEPNKNIEETVKEAQRLRKGGIVWFGRSVKELPGVTAIANPSIEEIPRLYNRAKCFLKMSKKEGWGRPIAEAKACGVPEIINQSGGNEEIEIVPWGEIANKLMKTIL